MSPKLKKIFYVWCALMSCLIAVLLLIGCGMPNHYNHKNSHYEPSNYIPPAPGVDLNSLIKKTTDPRYNFPE